jgi:hypothetical protein
MKRQHEKLLGVCADSSPPLTGFSRSGERQVLDDAQPLCSRGSGCDDRRRGLAATASARPAGTQCLQVRASVLKSIRAGLHAAVRPQLRSARAVKARGTFTGPRGFSNGVYFISSNLRARGIATWAVNERLFRTGGGLIYAMGKTARAVSDFGADLPPSVLVGWGIKTTTYGYAQSRACVK